MDTISEPAKSWMKEPPLIFAAMAEVMASVGRVEKTGHNKFDNYKYKTVEDMYAAVREAMGRVGVIPVLEIVEFSARACKSQKGVDQQHVTGRARVHFYAKDGSSISTDVVAEAIDRSDKAMAKWETAAMKSVLMATFLLSDKEQPTDTEQHSHEFAPESAAPKAEKPKAQPRRKHDPAKDSLTTAQIGIISRLQKSLGWTPADGEKACKDWVGCGKSELTETKANDFIGRLEAEMEKGGAQ